MKKLELLTIGLLFAACTDYVQQYEQDYKAEYGDAELYEQRHSGDAEFSDSTESSDSEESGDSAKSSDSEESSDSAKSSSSVNSSGSNGSSSSAKSSSSQQSSSSAKSSSSVQSSSSQQSSSSAKPFGTCKPSDLTVSTNSTVKWSFTWDTKNSGVATEQITVASYEWFTEGGSPASGTDKHFSTSYASIGLKTASVEVTTRSNGTQVIECSTLQVTPAADITSAIECNTDDLWCKSLTQTGVRVNTGLDAGDETSGYWYSFSDASDGGKSKIIWPDSKEEVDFTLVSACAGICGTAEISEEANSPYAGVGFHIAGYSSKADAVVPGDASGWGGVCITYMSEIEAKLELSLGEDLDKTLLAYDMPIVRLPKTSTLKDTCLAWTDFKQGGWGGKKKITGLEAAAQLVSINYTMAPNAYTKGTFNIFRLRKNPGWIKSINKMSWQNLNSKFSYGLMFDSRDSQYYKTTVIDGKTWMSEDLNYEVNDGQDSYCYDNDPGYCDYYGRLYTWNGAEKICPEGWHLPSKAELVSLCGAENGTVERVSALKSQNTWGSGYDGSDELGFSASQAGSYYQGDFLHDGNVVYWGSETSADGVMSGLLLEFGCLVQNVAIESINIPSANPVRCVRDD